MRLLIVPLVLTALIAAGAHAASTPKNPKSLALRAADMPGGVQPVNEKNGSVVPLPGGGQAKAYLAGWQFRNLARDEQVVITVIATGSAGQAQSLFSKLRAEVLKKTKGDAGALPRYGDEQLAATFRDGSTTNAWSTELLVRKNAIVWSLQVGAHPSSSKPFSRAQALTELRKYAAKQRLRAANG